MHLYIHIPFCHRECPYCAFYKHTPGRTKLKLFVDALLQELRLRLPQGGSPKSIFMGGGTPSMLSPVLFERLAAGLAAHLDLSQVQEWTLEANPATFNQKKAELWRRAGVTRVSMGVQSFHARLLNLLGREHSPKDIAESVATLRAAGIPQINLDLMFSLPTQSIQEWEDSLRQAIALRVEHISTYNLTFEEDTPFYRQYGADATDEDDDVVMFNMADERLTAAGYRHYEVSNYAKEGCRSIHNLSCWQGGDYLGIGPSACSTWKGERIENFGDTQAYIDAALKQELPPHRIEKLDEEMRYEEIIALALRTDEGIAPQLLRPKQASTIENLQEEGLAQLNAEGWLSLTLKGRLLTDEIALSLL